MKAFYSLLAVSALALAPQTYAAGWADTTQDLMNKAEQVKGTPTVSGMVSAVSESVGISQEQATGSLASIFNYAKNNISSEQFSALSAKLPGLDSLLNAVPQAEDTAESGSKMGSLMNKAASYSKEMAAGSQLQNQFASLGLEPSQVMQVIESAKAYLDTEQGQQIKQMLVQGLDKLGG